MAHTLFISDLHLDESNQSTRNAFETFLQQKAPEADAVYILGDLFEAWVGDDDETPFHQQMTHQLNALASKGIPIYFMHGNRDFLIGQKFSKRSGVQLLPDPSVITLYGRRVLLTHGDRLCTLDKKHQAYRKKVGKWWIQKLFLSIPLSFRRKFANRLRERSREHNRLTPSYITDVTDEEVIEFMTRNETQLLIHGHTHRPGIHKLTVNAQPAKRVVLGAWHHAPSVLVFHSDGKYELV